MAHTMLGVRFSKISSSNGANTYTLETINYVEENVGSIHHCASEMSSKTQVQQQGKQKQTHLSEMMTN